jgi:hypothetical protein
MKESNISFSRFCDSFSDTYKDKYSYAGKRALFDYLEEIEESTGEEVELDIVAICCEYSEYDSAYEAMQEYQSEDMPNEGEEGDDLTEIQEKNEAEAKRWLEDRTQVIEVEGGGVIIAQF